MEDQIRWAYRQILKEDPNKGLMGYAQRYAYLGLQNHFRGQDLKDNALRVVCNLQYWRGEKARTLKALLRKFISDPIEGD